MCFNSSPRKPIRNAEPRKELEGLPVAESKALCPGPRRLVFRGAMGLAAIKPGFVREEWDKSLESPVTLSTFGRQRKDLDLQRSRFFAPLTFKGEKQTKTRGPLVIGPKPQHRKTPKPQKNPRKRGDPLLFAGWPEATHPHISLPFAGPRRSSRVPDSRSKVRPWRSSRVANQRSGSLPGMEQLVFDCILTKGPLGRFGDTKDQ